jgi:hypothetical protein
MMGLRFAVTVSLCAIVSACGGGTTAGPVTTPPPPPTSGPPSSANASLLGTLVNESFTNDAATGTVSYPVSGAPATISAAQSTATVIYDAAAQKYDITVAGRSQSFRPSDIDAATSSAAISVYVKKDGSTTDSLTLTKPGESGRFTYKYVAGGYWQRTTTGKSAISGSLDAFAFGVETPVGSTPRSGYAAYSVDLLGAVTLRDSVQGITGQGDILVDFAQGHISTRALIDGLGAVGGATFVGDARLSSADGIFSGTADIFGNKSYSGAMNGRFYGPAANEVGAAFSVKASDGNAVVGTIIGRQSATPGGNSTIANMTSSQFLAGDSARLSFSGAEFSVPTQIRGNGTNSIAAYYNAATGTYDLLFSDNAVRIQTINTLSEGSPSFSGTSIYGAFSTYGPPAPYTPLRYLRTGRSSSGQAGVTQINDVVFGLATSDAALPRTGQAGYDIHLISSLAQPGATGLKLISGRGELVADFASNTLTTRGTLFEFTAMGLLGNFSGNGTIGASSNSFAGSLSFSGVGTYSGNMKGRFYGPAADEVGAAFSLLDAGGGVATGTLFGAKDPAITTARVPLAQISTPTDLYGIGVVIDPVPVGQAGYILDTTVRYSPSDGSYKFSSSTFPGNRSVVGTLTAADRVTAGSNASFDTYDSARLDGQLLKPDAANPTIALTYSSLANLTYAGDFNGQSVDYPYFAVFGGRTPSAVLPTTGSASYSGVIVGQGRHYGFSNDASLSGTSTLTANFANSQLSSTLSLIATDRASGTQMAIGTFEARGNINRIFPEVPTFLANVTGFSNLAPGGQVYGQLNGTFFGPNAEEFGGVFSVGMTDGPGPSANTSQFIGATIGKR